VNFKSKLNKKCRHPNTQIWTAVIKLAGPIVRTIYGAGLWPFTCWDSGFEFRWRHGCLSLVSGMCCRVYFSATGWSIVQRSPNECGVSECDLKTSTMRRPMPNMAVEPLGGRGDIDDYCYYLHWVLALTVPMHLGGGGNNARNILHWFGNQVYPWDSDLSSSTVGRINY
jgi:hypothetical protein